MSLLGRSFLKELDFTTDEWLALLDLSARLKAERREGRETKRLVGKQVALLFEKTSTRTRCAFEVAVADQGGTTTYLDPAGSITFLKPSKSMRTVLSMGTSSSSSMVSTASGAPPHE